MGFPVIFVLSTVFLLFPVGGGGSTETLYQEITVVDRFNVTDAEWFVDQSLSDCALMVNQGRIQGFPEGAPTYHAAFFC